MKLIFKEQYLKSLVILHKFDLYRTLIENKQFLNKSAFFYKLVWFNEEKDIVDHIKQQFKQRGNINFIHD